MTDETHTSVNSSKGADSNIKFNIIEGTFINEISQTKNIFIHKRSYKPTSNFITKIISRQLKGDDVPFENKYAIHGGYQNSNLYVMGCTYNNEIDPDYGYYHWTGIVDNKTNSYKLDMEKQIVLQFMNYCIDDWYYIGQIRTLNTNDNKIICISSYGGSDFLVWGYYHCNGPVLQQAEKDQEIIAVGTGFVCVLDEINNNVHVMGGRCDLFQHLVIDLKSNIIKKMPQLPRAIRNSGAVYFDGKIYIFGGAGLPKRNQQTITVDTDTWCYDIKSSNWKSLDSEMIHSWFNFVYVLTEFDNILVIDSNNICNVQVYDIHKNIWRELDIGGDLDASCMNSWAQTSSNAIKKDNEIHVFTKHSHSIIIYQDVNVVITGYCRINGINTSLTASLSPIISRYMTVL